MEVQFFGKPIYEHKNGHSLFYSTPELINIHRRLLEVTRGHIKDIFLSYLIICLYGHIIARSQIHYVNLNHQGHSRLFKVIQGH